MKMRPADNGAAIKFIKIAANTPLAPEAGPSVAPELSVAPVVMSGTAAGVSPNTGDRAWPAVWPHLGSLKAGTLPPLRLDLLSGELKHVNLNSGAAATIFEALAAANTKVTRTILVEADKVADELGLDDGAARFDLGRSRSGVDASSRGCAPPRVLALASGRQAVGVSIQRSTHQFTGIIVAAVINLAALWLKGNAPTVHENVPVQTIAPAVPQVSP